MRFGRIAGLDDRDIRNLSSPEPEGFDERTRVALDWVRSYMLFEGEFPDSGVDQSFRKSYTIGEQKAVFATLKLMHFFNMLMNLFDRRGSRLLRQ